MLCIIDLFALFSITQRVWPSDEDCFKSSWRSFAWSLYIRLSEKFLSFYGKIIDARCLLFYIILSNYIRSILFCWDKHHDISQTWFHVCMKVHCFKKHVCERKTLSGQPNTNSPSPGFSFLQLVFMGWESIPSSLVIEYPRERISSDVADWYQMFTSERTHRALRVLISLLIRSASQSLGNSYFPKKDVLYES